MSLRREDEVKVEHFAAVASRLERTVGGCATAADVEAIHRVRTGSRRLAAALEALGRETRETAEMRKNTVKLRRLLKKMRSRAGRVRDLDVHRELLGKMVLEGTAEGLGQQIAGLDAVLEQRRVHFAGKVQRRAEKWRKKLGMRAAALMEAAREAGDPPSGTEAGRLALEIFAALCREIPELDAGNLHAFRKGAKHARYIAEGGDDAWSQQTGKRLKRVQDAIGMWHDWLMLAEEARDAAGGQNTELVKEIEVRRERQLHSALKTSGRVRRELLGEWEGMAKKKVKRSGIEAVGSATKIA